MKKKMMKALRDLNDYIDNDREKLSDRIHELELSHKRMENLLRRSLEWIEDSAYFYDSESYYETRDQMRAFVHKVKQELSYPYFRANYKVKGGKKCV